MFGDDLTTSNAHEEHGIFNLSAYQSCVIINYPYERGPAPRCSDCGQIHIFSSPDRVESADYYRCPGCGQILIFSSSDRVEGADYYRCPGCDQPVKRRW